MLEIRLLGELQLNSQAATHKVGRRLSALLLVYLLLHREHPVALGQLATAIWPEVPDEKARGNLRRYLHFLQKDLPEARAEEPWLLRDRNTVQWNPAAPMRLDIDRFEALARHGEIAADSGQFEAAMAALEEASRLYTGDVMPDRNENWLVAARQRLEARRDKVLELRVRLNAARGEYGAARELLDQLVALQPGREDLLRMHLWLLLQLEGHAAARMAFEQYLAGQKESDGLEARTEALGAALEDKGDLSEWHPGRRFVDVGAGKPDEYGDSASRLPLRGDAFIGRDREIEQLRQLLSISRLVTLTGPGGAGKTRLTTELSRRHGPSLGEALIWVDLQGLELSGLVPREVAATLALRPEPNRDLADVIAEAIGERKLLMVLDNCEHLVPGLVALTQVLLTRCPALRLLATSRERINVPGEVTWEIPSLSIPDSDAGRPAGGEESEAAQLFLARVHESWPEFEARPERMASIRRICRMVEGIPLAIELAAARVGVLSVEEIAGQLEDSFRLLRRRDREHPSRHETLDRSIAWGYELLGESEQVLLRRLAIFSGPFSFDAASAIYRDDKDASDLLAEADLFDLIGRLIDKSFVRQEEIRDGHRAYRLLEMIRQFGQRQLGQAGERESLERRRGEHVLALAERAAPHLAAADASVWIGRLDDTRNDLLAAMRWMPEREEWHLAARLGAALWRYWQFRGYLEFERGWLDRVLEAPKPGLEPELSITLWRGAAVLAHVATDSAAAASMFKEGLAQAEQAGAGDLIAQLHDNLGILELYQGDYRSAYAHYSEALEHRRRLGDDRSAVRSANLLADIAVRLGDYDEAASIYGDLKTRLGAEQNDLTLDEYLMFQGLAQIAFYRGDYAEAQQHIDTWFEIAESLKSLGHTSGAMILQGRIFSDLDDFDGAAKRYGKALSISRELGSQHHEAAVLHLLGENELRRGRHASAKVYLERSLKVKRETGLEAFASYTVVELAKLQLEMGEIALARTTVDEGREMAEHLGLKSVLAQACLVSAEIALAEGEPEVANIALRQAFELQLGLREKRAIALGLAVAGRLATAAGDEATASRWIAEAERLRAAMRIGAAPTDDEAAAFATQDEASEQAAGMKVGSLTDTLQRAIDELAGA
jgi:predicted ATPase/DNA-binding SARP family transcriptional activator/Tfp pilus assembly protein PilF